MQAKDSEVPGTLQAFNQQNQNFHLLKLLLKMTKISVVFIEYIHVVQANKDCVNIDLSTSGLFSAQGDWCVHRKHAHTTSDMTQNENKSHQSLNISMASNHCLYVWTFMSETLQSPKGNFSLWLKRRPVIEWLLYSDC